MRYAAKAEAMATACNKINFILAGTSRADGLAVIAALVAAQLVRIEDDEARRVVLTSIEQLTDRPDERGGITTPERT
jgi:hypothetical protein